MKKKKAEVVIDSRHLKILAIKRDILKHSVVFVCLDEHKFGHMDKTALKKIVNQIDNLEPSGAYFPLLRNIDVQLYDKDEFINRNVLVTIGHPEDEEINKGEVEELFRKSLPNVKSISFIHSTARIVRQELNGN